MYELEIETKNTIKKIEEPRKATVIDLAITSLVRVMDGKGKWHKIGFYFSLEDANIIADNINYAIEQRETAICIDY